VPRYSAALECRDKRCRRRSSNFSIDSGDISIDELPGIHGSISTGPMALGFKVKLADSSATRGARACAILRDQRRPCRDIRLDIPEFKCFGAEIAAKIFPASRV